MSPKEKARELLLGVSLLVLFVIFLGVSSDHARVVLLEDKINSLERIMDLEQKMMLELCCCRCDTNKVNK